MPTEDLNKEIDKLQIPHNDIWEYSAMQEAMMVSTGIICSFFPYLEVISSFRSCLASLYF